MANYIGAKTAGVIANVDGGVIENATLGSSVTFPAGHILQMQSVAKKDTFSVSITAGGVEDIPNMTLNLTPSSSSNKILILTMINGASNYTGRQGNFAIRLLRNGVNIALPTGYGNRPPSWFAMDIDSSDNSTSNSSSFGMFTDEPSTTSEVTYKLQFLNYTSSTTTFYLNQTSNTDNTPFRNRTISTMTIMEVQG